MLVHTLRKLFSRDINRLKEEIKLYSKEENLWIIQDSINNSAGNLCLHLIGNLNTFIGVVLGTSNYTRDRDAEFNLKNVSKDKLLEQLEETRMLVDVSLENLNENRLQEEFPIQVFSEKTSIAYMLIHLTTHLTYHRGQINYHRRLLDQKEEMEID